MRRAKHQLNPTSLKHQTSTASLAVVRQHRKETEDDVRALRAEGVPIKPPRTRAECPPSRPCPYVGCRYNLWQDVTIIGSIKVNFVGIEPWQLKTSCALDVCDANPEGLTLEETGAMMNLTRERIRQIESAALEKIRDGLNLSQEQVELLIKAANKAYNTEEKGFKP